MEEFGKFVLDKIGEISNKIEELGEDQCQDYGLGRLWLSRRAVEFKGEELWSAPL